MESNEYCVVRQQTRKRKGEFRSIYFIVGGKVWNMDRGTGMCLRKVCPQCSTVIHTRRSICECGHAFTLKREARNTASSPAKRKRALESLEDTLRKQENNRIHIEILIINICVYMLRPDCKPVPLESRPPAL